MKSEFAIREQLAVVNERERVSLKRRLELGDNEIPQKMDVQDGEDCGWRRALEWVLE